MNVKSHCLKITRRPSRRVFNLFQSMVGTGEAIIDTDGNDWSARYEDHRKRSISSLLKFVIELSSQMLSPRFYLHLFESSVALETVDPSYLPNIIYIFK